MNSSERIKRLGWFLPLKLASYIILMSVVVVWMGFPQYLQAQIVAYSFLTLAFTIALSLEKKIKLQNALTLLIALQILVEISIESGVIYATGNVNSSFSALYILTIVSAALAYRLVGTLLVASTVSAAYAFIIWLGLSSGTDSEISVQALKTIFSAQDSVFYSIFLHILIFYLVAFISGYLAERLSSSDLKLENASRELRRAKLETDEILTHLNSGLLTVDSRGEIIYFNKAAEHILGYTEEQAQGMLCSEIFGDRMPALAACLMDGINSRIVYPRKELTILGRYRNELPLGLSTSILSDESGRLRGIIGIFTELTEAKQLEAKVRSADRLAAVGELSASIAHEIRNPLASISGSVQVLRSELELTGDNGRLMDLIVKESDRLTNILTDFLVYSRISRPVFNKVELCHIITDVIELLRHDDSYNDKITIGLKSDEVAIYVVGDEGLIKQLIMNLAINACQAFESGNGEIIFSIFKDEQAGKVNLFVSDDGPGIADDVHSKVFEPFFSTKKDGTGLGLSIVHRIVTAIKATIRLLPDVSKGTTFQIGFSLYGWSPQKTLPTEYSQEKTSPTLFSS